MPTLNIPSIGTSLTLTKKWSFTLYGEFRNEKFWKTYCKVKPSTEELDEKRLWEFDDDEMQSVELSLPAGTELNLDRIYVRKGKQDFDSISLFIKNCPIKGIKGRFWVKLEDANKLSYS